MSSNTNTTRRTVIRVLGVVGTGLYATNPVAAHSDTGKGKGKGKGKSQGRGEGRGRYCRGNGRGRGLHRGNGYKRDHPHRDDETRWDDDPELGKPKKGKKDDSEDDEEDDDEEGEEEETPNEDIPEDERATGIVRVVDENSEPVEGEPVTLWPPGTVEEEGTVTRETGENGEVEIILLAGSPTDVTMFTVVVRDEEQRLGIMSDEHTGVQEVVFEVSSDDEEPEAPPVEITVTDDSTDEPIEGAEVDIVTADVDPDDIERYVFETDENGKVEEDIDIGNFIATVSAEGYEDQSKEVGLEHEAEFALTPVEGEEEPDVGNGEDEGDEGDPEGDEEPDQDVDDPETVSERIEQRIHAEVNEYREEQDLEPLEFDAELATVAREHSEDMADSDYFAHTSPDGDGPGDRLDDAELDCDAWAENIAFEYDSQFSDDDAASVADSITQGWIDSEGHRENILGDYSEQGVGVAVTDDSEIFATELFCG